MDYIEASIEAARAEITKDADVEFVVGDCRIITVPQQFDAAVCLYDVVGSYVDDADNLAILRNLARHVKPGAYVLVSVMNFELTAAQCPNHFSITSEPDRLLELQASNTMEKTGNVFDPRYCLVDPNTRIVYRKEEFLEGKSLPDELLVRDRRFSRHEIEDFCAKAVCEEVAAYADELRGHTLADKLPPDTSDAADRLRRAYELAEADERSHG